MEELRVGEIIKKLPADFADYYRINLWPSALAAGSIKRIDTAYLEANSCNNEPWFTLSYLPSTNF